MKLTHTELRSFFYGTLLGDSYIHNNSFCCKQTIKELVDFKTKIVKQYLPDVKVSTRIDQAYTDKNNVNHNQSYMVFTNCSSKYIKKLNKQFYPIQRKIYPIGSISKLTPIGLAMLYADDGTTILVQKNLITKGCKNRRCQICTDHYTKDEQEIMLDEFKKIGFNGTLINRHRKNQFRIQLDTQDAQRFMCIIEPYFYYFPKLLYKLDMGYRGETLNSKYVSKEYRELFLRISAHPNFIDRMALKFG